MRSADYYRGDSIRIENGGSGKIYGKFRGAIRHSWCSVVENEEAEPGEDRFGFWCWHGVGGGDYATEEEALAAGIELLERSGWTANPAIAEAEADRLAAERHEAHCRKSAAYAKYYG